MSISKTIASKWNVLRSVVTTSILPNPNPPSLHQASHNLLIDNLSLSSAGLDPLTTYPSTVDFLKDHGSKKIMQVRQNEYFKDSLPELRPKKQVGFAK